MLFLIKSLILLCFSTFPCLCANNIDSVKNNKNSNLIFDKVNSNKRSSNIISIQNTDKNNIRFTTDTTQNFKSKKDILAIYGKPMSEREVIYEYDPPNVLWIMEGPLEDKIKECVVLMMEWEYKETRRVVLFIKEDGEWLSVTNIEYPLNLNW